MRSQANFLEVFDPLQWYAAEPGVILRWSVLVCKLCQGGEPRPWPRKGFLSHSHSPDSVCSSCIFISYPEQELYLFLPGFSEVLVLTQMKDYFFLPCRFLDVASEGLLMLLESNMLKQPSMGSPHVWKEAFLRSRGSDWCLLLSFAGVAFHNRGKQTQSVLGIQAVKGNGLCTPVRESRGRNMAVVLHALNITLKRKRVAFGLREALLVAPVMDD